MSISSAITTTDMQIDKNIKMNKTQFNQFKKKRLKNYYIILFF